MTISFLPGSDWNPIVPSDDALRPRYSARRRYWKTNWRAPRNMGRRCDIAWCRTSGELATRRNLSPGNVNICEIKIGRGLNPALEIHSDHTDRTVLPAVEDPVRNCRTDPNGR